MKNIKRAFSILAITILFTACSSDNSENISGIGNLEMEFDNAYSSNDLVLGTQENTTSNGEILKINSVKYIISNIVLTNENGAVFTYPKSDSYFIADESGQAVLELENIPAGNYTKVKFGIGIDEGQYALGAENQGSFLAIAQSAGMISSFADGYTNLSFTGTFTSPTVAAETLFTVKTTKTASDSNYREVTLNLPTKALVRADITPEIHIIADVSKIIDGSNKTRLSEHLSGSETTINSGEILDLITANLTEMFTVAHVHND
jgi:hypothetical protein